MYDLQKIAAECINELKAIDIPIQDEKIEEIVAVPLDEDGCTGHCIITDNGLFKIEIWHEMLNDGVRFTTLKRLICHELIHTCKNCMNHRGEFRRYARRTDKHYSYGLMVGDDDCLHPEKPVLLTLKCPKCKYTQIYRNEKHYKDIMEMYDISENLLPKCPFCRAVTVLVSNE